MNRTASMTVLVLTASLIASLLAGCFTARIHLTVNWKGSTDVEVLMYAPRWLMVFRDTARLFNEFKSDFSARGFTVEDYEEGSRIGFRAFGKAVSPNDFFKPDNEDILVLAKEAPFIVERHFFTNIYRIETEINLGKLMEEDLATAPLLPDIRFLLTLPVRPSEHNADAVSEDGKTLEWILRPGGCNRIQISASAPGTGAILLAAAALAACAVATIKLLVPGLRKT